EATLREEANERLVAVGGEVDEHGFALLSDEAYVARTDGLAEIETKLRSFADGKRSGTIELDDRQMEELRRLAEKDDISWSLFDDLFEVPPRERLATETIAPL